MTSQGRWHNWENWDVKKKLACDQKSAGLNRFSAGSAHSFLIATVKELLSKELGAHCIVSLQVCVCNPVEQGVPWKKVVTLQSV